MTDKNPADGSGKPGIPPQGNGSEGKAANGAADPFAGLQDAGIREWVGKAGFKDTSTKSFEDMAKKARDAESLIGRSVQLPGDDAKAEDIDKFVSKATEKYRPKDAAGYDFKLPDGVPKEMPYDGDGAKEFKGVAHELGLTASQAQRAHDWFVKRQAGTFTAAAEGLAKTAGDATASLEKAWGSQDSDGFKESVQLALKGAAANDKAAKLSDGATMQALRDARLVGPGDIILSAPIAMLLRNLGGFHAEDRLIDGKSANADNPFASGSENATAQNRLAKADPDKARRLIRQAGREKDFPSFMQPRT